MPDLLYLYAELTPDAPLARQVESLSEADLTFRQHPETYVFLGVVTGPRDAAQVWNAYLDYVSDEAESV